MKRLTLYVFVLMLCAQICYAHPYYKFSCTSCHIENSDKLIAEKTEKFEVLVIDGNNLFNGNFSPSLKDDKYELYDNETKVSQARRSVELNAKILLLDNNGTVYFPVPKKGTFIGENPNTPRYKRILSEEDKKHRTKDFVYLPTVVGHRIEIEGIVYPGWSGIKGIYIISVKFSFEYKKKAF